MRTEKFYFSASDLMIRADIDDTNNKVRYVAHRVPSFGEKAVVEKYIEDNVLSCDNIYYNGQDINLVKVHRDFSEKMKRKKLQESINLLKINKEMLNSINEVKAGANREFCFNRIGDLLRDRNEKHSEEPEYRLAELKELVLEYNDLVDKNKRVNINTLIK